MVSVQSLLSERKRSTMKKPKPYFEVFSHMMTELEFKSLVAKGFNRIPLMQEAFADLETPLSLYMKLAFSKDGGRYSFLLESVVGGERIGRYVAPQALPPHHRLQ